MSAAWYFFARRFIRGVRSAGWSGIFIIRGELALWVGVGVAVKLGHNNDNQRGAP